MQSWYSLSSLLIRQKRTNKSPRGEKLFPYLIYDWSIFKTFDWYYVQNRVLLLFKSTRHHSSKHRQDDLGHEVISRQGPLTHAAERIDRTMMKPILLIALAALTHVSMAFVPLAHSRRLITVRRQSSLARTAAVGVSMNLFERFGRVAKANINELLNTIKIFSSLKKCHIEGIDSINSNFDSIVESIKRKPYDILDHRQPGRTCSISD